jgi:hypothetical protein
MNEIQLLVKLYELHETRKGMSEHSLYHGVYVEEAIKLNNALKKISGKNYSTYSKEQINNAIVENALLNE